MNKIQKFIKENNLDINQVGSNLNSVCCAIAGYALYLSKDTNDFEQLITDIEAGGLYKGSHAFWDELERVYEYAYYNNYSDWWIGREAEDTYVFEKVKE